MTTLTLRPDWAARPSPFRHTWEEIVNVDQFRWLGRHDLLEQLALTQRELGTRHVRAVGLFDDELRVFCPGPETFGAPEPRPRRTNWQLVDGIWDALLARGLRPLVTTTFIPSAMASGPTTVFTTQGHTSPPSDYRAWGELVAECVRHAIDRHGLAEVRQWYFEAWNEPNLEGWFWGADQAEFWKLWAATWRAIKSVDAGLRVGGPSTARGEWLADFLAYTARHDCRPDYLALHVYNNDGESGALAPFAGPQEDRAGTCDDRVMVWVDDLAVGGGATSGTSFIRQHLVLREAAGHRVHLCEHIGRRLQQVRVLREALDQQAHAGAIAQVLMQVGEVDGLPVLVLRVDGTQPRHPHGKHIGDEEGHS